MGNVIYCSFCGHTQEEARRLAGAGGGDPNVYICNYCATLFGEQMNERRETDCGDAGIGGDFRCFFCGQIRNASCFAARKPESDVCICTKCLEVRYAIMKN